MVGKFSKDGDKLTAQVSRTLLDLAKAHEQIHIAATDKEIDYVLGKDHNKTQQYKQIMLFSEGLMRTFQCKEVKYCCAAICTQLEEEIEFLHEAVKR